MGDRVIAFSPVVVPDKGYGVAIVEENVAGFSLDPSEEIYATWVAAHRRATDKNEAMNIDAANAWRVVTSSIAASNKINKKWGPRGS
jgi:hypothetical protein